MRTTTRKIMIIVLAAILSCGPTLTANAQDDDRTWLQVRTVQVKTDRMGDFIDLQKALVEASVDAGRPGRSVWREVRGDTATFHFVTSADNMAELDEPFDPPMDDDDWSDWVDDIMETTRHISRQILRSHREWTLPPTDDSDPDLLLLRTIDVKSGSMADFHVWIRDRLLPALKSGNAGGITFNHVAFGGDTSTWIIGARVPDWAALQSRRGNLAHMNDFEYGSLMRSMAAMTEGAELRVLRYQPELSW